MPNAMIGACEGASSWFSITDLFLNSLDKTSDNDLAASKNLSTSSSGLLLFSKMFQLNFDSLLLQRILFLNVGKY